MFLTHKYDNIITHWSSEELLWYYCILICLLLTCLCFLMSFVLGSLIRFYFLSLKNLLLVT